MSVAGVLPVLRAPQHARLDTDVFHVEIPGDRVGATPWAAFTVGGGLLSRAEVAAGGLSSSELLETATQNLQARPASWEIADRSAGFLGLGKKVNVLVCTDEFAVERLLLSDFLQAGYGHFAKSPARPPVLLFAPRRGQLRVVLAERDGGPTPFLAREREAARAAWETAGPGDAVCPAALAPSFIVGNTFGVRDLFAGEPQPYVPPLENVRLMVLHSSTFSYLTDANVAPRRPLVGELYLYLGVRDQNGQQTPLRAETLDALGLLPFERTLEGMLAKVPPLEALDMGRLPTGQPVAGFRGHGAIDQLARPESLARLHAKLGDPFLIHAYSHVRVGATTAEAPLTPSTLYELIELCDPKPPNVIMTRGTPDYELYRVSGGRLTGMVTISPR